MAIRLARFVFSNENKTIKMPSTIYVRVLWIASAKEARDTKTRLHGILSTKIIMSHINDDERILNGNDCNQQFLKCFFFIALALWRRIKQKTNGGEKQNR